MEKGRSERHRRSVGRYSAMEAADPKEKGEEMRQDKKGVNWKWLLKTAISACKWRREMGIAYVSVIVSVIAILCARDANETAKKGLEFAYRPYVGISEVSEGDNYAATLGIRNSGSVPANDVSCEIVRSFEHRGGDVYVDTTMAHMVIFPEGTRFLTVSPPPGRPVGSVWSISIKITYQGVDPKKQYPTECKIQYDPKTMYFSIISGRGL